MVLRVLQALAGAILAAGGGYFAWVNRGSVDGMFPPEPGLSVWTFVAGLVSSIIGAVAIVHALGPRPKAKARRIEEEEKRDRVLKQAEQFYTAQAEDLASVGTNAGEPLFPEGLRPSGAPRRDPEPEHAPEPEQPSDRRAPPETFRLHTLSQPPPRPPPAAPEPAPPAHSNVSRAEPADVDLPKAAEPVPASRAPEPARPAPAFPAAPSTDPISPAPARPFPAPVSSGILPRAHEAPPPVSVFTAAATDIPQTSAVVENPAAAQDTQTAPANGAAADPGLDEIRSAIAQNRLDDADRLLASTRKRMNDAGASDPVELAQLTGLAGDHAAADGRLGSAKWLWRLALQRFAAAGAIDNPAARAVSERMRLADQ